MVSGPRAPALFFIFFDGGIDQTIDAWKRVRDRVRELGRSVTDFGGEYVSLSGGDIGELTREIQTWRDAGGIHVSVVTKDLGLNSIEGHLEDLAAIAGVLGLS